ncbi:YchJ family protein [Cellvibrio sp. OA-2007]|uniref:YchJ family protein n=1 Tax=Cellvibrio sp. OA-2007 TaxID=529823 RepID=UPI00126A23BA|nr:YchJ family metal-binding protein [Cellvibrio sp. OA-2007]
MPPKTPLNEAHAHCPCGSTKVLNNCCLPFIEGKYHASTAEQLMRSRYTAHALLAIDYLWGTWSPEQRLRSSKADIRAWAESCEWLGLQILGTHQGGIEDEFGIVEFVAVFKQQGQLHQHHEVSEFKKVLGKWLYIDHQQ